MRKRRRFVCFKPSRDSLVAAARPPAMTAVLAERPFFGTLFACAASCCVRRRARSQVLVGQNATPRPGAWLFPSVRSFAVSPQGCARPPRDRVSAQHGAQKYQIWPVRREASQGAIGESPAEIAEIAEIPTAVHPMGETAKMRAAVSCHCLGPWCFRVKREI